ncbi:formin-like protein 4 [Durio zibethinus]|uniref:Formin-like protein n=1 Tax=Durio zibethinus TaxID=66656 RepID=A0A6P6BG35_DURZI|nr:formin-like protein 4 [Durio zibethinus]
MAVKFQTLIFINLMVVFFISVLPFAYSQGSPQNIEVFYPSAPSPAPDPISPKPSSALPGPERSLDSQPPPPSSPSSSNDTNSTIAKAVAATAASTIVIAGIFFFFIRKYVVAQRKRERVGDSLRGGQARVLPDDFARVNGPIKGLIVDENGLDVLYWRQLEDGESKNGFHKEILHSPKDEEEGGMVRKGSRSKKVEPVQEIPLLRGKSSTSHVPPPEDVDDDDSSENIGPLPPPPSHGIVLKAVEKREAPVQSKFLPPASMQPAQPPTPPPPPPLPIQNNNRSPVTPQPPPPPAPPVPAKTPVSPPPPPNKAGGSATFLKPPPAASDKSSRGKSGESSGDGATDGNNQMKLKPLHWDKVNKKNVGHSMVWDKINGGSFKFDDDLMEALFGYVVTNRKSATGSSNSKNTTSTNASPSAQIMVLDARKSQNIAIVLKSLALSRRELLEALNEGHGLEADTVEKLMRIAPTEEEQSQILDFDGDPTRLADAESFLFHILNAIPSAFIRLNAMQFRTNYDLEILLMKESLQTLEFGCKELRSQRLFMKLLEAILKAGNRMNAGTARGNAQAFNLNSLLKLSDVKSTDGKTTLLHFVVEEVVRSQGKKCFISRSHSLSRSSSSSRSSNISSSDHSTPKEEDREKEYIMLGLPVVGGLSAEFTNVKKAATVDFNTFSGTCSALTARVAEVKQLALQCVADGKGGFVQEMKGFLDHAEEELNAIREEQKRVMDLVRRTKEYYQAGASKDPFQIFVIVRDFLGMVDGVCAEIARNQQRRKSSTANYGSQSPNLQESRTKMRFPVLPSNFMTGKSRINSSDTDVDS